MSDVGMLGVELANSADCCEIFLVCCLAVSGHTAYL